MCPPCKVLGPTFQRHAHHIQDQARELLRQARTQLTEQVPQVFRVRRAPPELSPEQLAVLEDLRQDLRQIHEVADRYVPLREAGEQAPDATTAIRLYAERRRRERER